MRKSPAARIYSIILCVLLCSQFCACKVDDMTADVTATESISDVSETALTSGTEKISADTSFSTVSAAESETAVSKSHTETERFSETSETVSASEKNEVSANTPFSTEPAAESETSATKPLTMEFGYCAFDDAELLSESEVIALAEQVRDGFKQSDIVKDHTEFDDMGIPFDGSYNIMIVPAGVDFEEYCSDEKNFPMHYEEEYENGVLEKLGENDIYSQWRNAYTEIRRMEQNNVPTVMELDREYRRVFLKNFVRNENNAFSYTGKMNAEDIMRNFDIFTYSPLGIKICRRVVENSESFTYEFYCAGIIGGDWGLNDEAVIEGKSIKISKKDGSFSSEGKTFYEASYEIPDTALSMEWYD